MPALIKSIAVVALSFALDLLTVFSPPTPADDAPCSSEFCCESCDPNDLGCSGCTAIGRDGCGYKVISCPSGTCYNGGGACGNTSSPWSGGCCS